ncbi:hypothetical protein PSTG_15356 [Puccinia striiformis f. sp. tritici PST-78]|uniref:DNA 3'-5' helicase n=1 Tax=Puccinia striiformis f. sp. tritici PST-78 TaxID=1165861 RepID=A0A0L0UW05_9BASI|nr:hypothetical protein PSTG_15356 [Puccinia striiformis f. sp. tritici PST-78]
MLVYSLPSLCPASSESIAPTHEDSSSHIPLSTSTMIRPRSPKRVISPLTPRRVWSLTGVNVKQRLFKKRDDKLKQHIADVSLSRYGEPSKQLQIEAVFNLVEGRNTFLLAGTGYGKSCIAEMYYKMIPDKKRAVVLVLNPLDTLDDNQVAEKRLAGFTAINLTKLTFNAQAAEDIKNGVYQFVYLSPEIFLNSKMFQMVYYSSEFQNRLALVVVDESHMIYIWGLVESGPAGKSISAHFCHEDYGIFRPSHMSTGCSGGYQEESQTHRQQSCQPPGTCHST